LHLIRFLSNIYTIVFFIISIKFGAYWLSHKILLIIQYRYTYFIWFDLPYYILLRSIILLTSNKQLKKLPSKWRSIWPFFSAVQHHHQHFPIVGQEMQPKIWLHLLLFAFCFLLFDGPSIWATGCGAITQPSRWKLGKTEKFGRKMLAFLWVCCGQILGPI